MEYKILITDGARMEYKIRTFKGKKRVRPPRLPPPPPAPECGAKVGIEHR